MMEYGLDRFRNINDDKGRPVAPCEVMTSEGMKWVKLEEPPPSSTVRHHSRSRRGGGSRGRRRWFYKTSAISLILRPLFENYFE